MNEYPLVTQLKEASDYDKVFALVKSTVEKSISQHRAGLTLILAEIPNLPQRSTRRVRARTAAARRRD